MELLEIFQFIVLPFIVSAFVPMLLKLIERWQSKTADRKLQSEAEKLQSESNRTDAETDGLMIKNASSIVELWQAAYKELKEKTDTMQEASKGRDLKISELQDTVITLRNRQRAILAFVSNVLDAIKEHRSDIFAIVDEKKKCVYISPNVFEVLGYSPLDFLGKDRSDLIHLDDLPIFENIFSYSLQFPEITSKIFIRFMHKDGGYRHMETTVMNLLQTHVQGIFFSSRDITKIKIAEDEFKRLYTMETTNATLTQN